MIDELQLRHRERPVIPAFAVYYNTSFSKIV
jgi:hypothetical protein